MDKTRFLGSARAVLKLMEAYRNSCLPSTVHQVEELMREVEWRDTLTKSQYDAIGQLQEQARDLKEKLVKLAMKQAERKD